MEQPKCRCGSINVKRNGFKYRKSGLRQQYKCVDCGFYWTAKEEKKEDFGTQTAKILLLDIETAPMHGRFWRIGKQVIGIEQIEKDWFILGWSAKWLFSNEVFSDFVTSEESLTRDDSRILKSIWKLMDDATVIIGHNIKGFDNPNLVARFMCHQILPPSPYQLLDTYYSSKNIGISSHKLKYINIFLGLKKKLDTDYQLWIDCEAGDQKSLDYMEKYCKGDCLALEEAFIEMRPYIKTGINLALHNHSGESCCSSCGSTKLVEKGYYYTSVSRFTSYQCSNCGAYSRSRTSDVKPVDKKVLLAPVAR